MNQRPELNQEMCGAKFCSFYYLKQELVGFCRKNRLPASGNKQELTD